MTPPREIPFMKTDVTIVGAGLSGLYTAYRLKQHNISTTVCEARGRPGGRILSEVPFPDIAAGIDMGPSWFWPWQTRMLSLLRELELESGVYEQHSQGMSIAEYRSGQRVRQQGTASMAGSLRLSGGLNMLVHALSDRIGAERFRYDSKVVHLEHVVNEVVVKIDHRGTETTMQTDKIILAVPPRVLANSVSFCPELDPAEKQIMEDTSTWMAGQAKFAAVYDTPFWREQGLSGDGISEIGPLGEIHDASAPVGAPYALFGFLGLPSIDRLDRDEEIINAATEQLSRMFGSGQQRPTHVYYKDWADDVHTATAADRNGPRSHVHQTVSTQALWNSRLYWAGSETASIASGSNGYLEGALAAADRVVDQILETHKPS